MRFVTAGATGFLGRALCAKWIAEGHEVTALVRDAADAKTKLDAEVILVAWGNGTNDWKASINGTDAVVNFAGEPVAGERWTNAAKRRIRDSRTETTRALVDAIRDAERRPEAFISASAVGYYGDTKDAPVTEETPPGNDFLAEVCTAWEAEAKRAAEFGVREARMRIGIVLGDGGALKAMLNPLPVPLSPWQFGLGGPMGSGKQWFPWIHVADVIGLFAWAAVNPAVSGAINTTAPNPVTNAAFAQAIGRVLHRPAIIPVPGFALKLLLGEFADSLLGGQKALPKAAEHLGYGFRFREVQAALEDLLRP